MANGMTNGKRDIVKRMKVQIPNLTQKEIEHVIDVYLETIRTEIEKGNSVLVPRFGKFDVVEIEKDRHYNPITDEYENKKVIYKRVTFKSSKTFRDRINNREDK